MLLRLLLALSPLLTVAQDAVGSTGCTASACVFANPSLRFGTGSENSVNNWGLFVQPWYYSYIANAWYKLTFSSYPLDTAVGTGSGGPNWSGNTVVDLYTQTPTNAITDYSQFVVDSSDATKSVGHGKIFSLRTFTILGQTVIINNTFSLGATDSFVKIITTVTNADVNPIVNMKVWVGTRDDYVGSTDSNTKTRGNLASGAFVAVTENSQSSRAIMITNPTEGVLFYSETPDVMTAYALCCSFSNVYNTNPLSLAPATPSPTDGSYAAVLPIGSFDVGMSSSITWYYAAGAISSLASVATSVAVDQQAGAGPSDSPTATLTPTPSMTLSETATETPTATASDTATETPSQTPSETPSNTVTQTSSQTPSQTSSNTVTETPSHTPSNTASQTPSQTPSQTASQTPSNTTTQTPSNSPSKTASQTASQTPSETSTRTPSQTISATPTASTTATPAMPSFIHDLTIINNTQIITTNTVATATTNMLIFLYVFIPVNLVILCICCVGLCAYARLKKAEPNAPKLKLREFLP